MVSKFSHLVELSALLVVLAASSVGGTPQPIYSAVPIHASLAPNGTVCYHFALDPNTTREVVYWPAAKLHVRLTPCTGTPHLRASVHGCPSDGHVVNFEFQNTKSRNDMLAKNMTVAPMWEWMGDTETLSLDVTHRNFYIEVTQFHPPMRTNDTKRDLSRRLRNKKFDKQADVVDDMIYKGVFGREEAAQLRALQEMVMPVANYELVVHLHDNKEFPDLQLTPLASEPGFNRNIELVDPGVLSAEDPLYGAYIIAWYPPTWSAPTSTNASDSNSTANNTARTGTTTRLVENEQEDLPHHHRRLLSMHDQGTKDVTWGQVEDLLSGEPWAMEQLSAARSLLSPEDVIFYAHPGAANAGRASEPKLTGRQLHSLKLTDPEHPEHRQTVAQEKQRIKALDEVDEKLAALASHPDFEDAVRRGTEDFEERKLAVFLLNNPRLARRSALTTRAISNSSSSANSTAPGTFRELTLKEKAERPIVDEELEYLVYWVDITRFVQDRWGVIQDGLLNDYTRLFDFNSSKGFYCKEESEDGLCGIHQLIARQEFDRLDKLGNGDGRLQRQELYAEFPPDGNAAFKKDWDWDKAVDYGKSKMMGGSGLAMRAWEEAFGGSQELFDSSFKDPLLRNYWTVCGLNGSSTPLVLSGNISRDAGRFEWLGHKSFDKDDKGRVMRGIKGLADDDNNVYIVNVVVRHTVTKEQVAYKPHVLQRRSPIYESAETSGPQQMAIIYAAIGSAAGIVAIFVAAVVYSKSRKSRPKLRIVQTGPTGPLLAKM